MRRFPLSTILLGVFALTMSATVSAGTTVEKPVEAQKPVEARTPVNARFAHLILKGAYPEGAQLPGLFGSAVESLADGITRLDKVAADKKIDGVILKIKNPQLGWAKLNELRKAIARVRAKGKKVYAVLDSGTSKDYLLASACDVIVMPESGSLMVLGLRAEVSFYKNLFDKLDVKADMIPVGEFKSAAEPYMLTEMSPAFRLQMEAVLDDYFRQMVDAIANGRKLDRDKVIEAINSGPHTAKTAKQLGLIDHVAYEDQLDEIIKAGNGALGVKTTRKYGKKKIDTDFSGFAGMVKMMNLLMGIDTGRRGSRRPKIAIITAEGAIMSGRSTESLFGGKVLGSDTLIKAVRKAAADKKVKAIVLRVNSPGGSALASDLMWRALEKIDKPVVVSMGDVAASGGYYIAMGADCIFAEPGTLTGSIGVVGGKIALKGLYEKLGITTSIISRGKNSGTFSTLDGFTDSERKAVKKMLDDIYEQFTKKAAKGRKMEYEQLEKLARGRIYTGAMALKIGLVDELGTLDDAVARAKKLAGLKPEEKIDRLLLPKAISPFEALFGSLDTDARIKKAQQSAFLEMLRELSPEMVEHLKAIRAVEMMLSHESILMLLPFRLSVK